MDPTVWIISDRAALDDLDRSLVPFIADAGYATTLAVCDDVLPQRVAAAAPALLIGVMAGWSGPTLSVYRALTALGMPPLLLIFDTPAAGDVVTALEQGAADVLVMPLSLPELAARLRALLRRRVRR